MSYSTISAKYPLRDTEIAMLYFGSRITANKPDIPCRADLERWDSYTVEQQEVNTVDKSTHESWSLLWCRIVLLGGDRKSGSSRGIELFVSASFQAMTLCFVIFFHNNLFCDNFLVKSRKFQHIVYSGLRGNILFFCNMKLFLDECFVFILLTN